MFPNLADSKEPVRQAANAALNACRAAYPPNQLCSSLCPRVLELAPGRARTGLLEFLAVLVPHSASFLLQGGNHSGAGGGGGGGHLQSLTQRVAAALVQSPPPANWDGGLGEDGPTSAGSAASAAIRLLTALYRLDREALAVASTGLPPESAAAVRRALSFCRTASPFSSPAGPAAVVVVGASSSSKITVGQCESSAAASAAGSPAVASVASGNGRAAVDAAFVTPVPDGGRVGFGSEVENVSGGNERSSPPPSLASPPRSLETQQPPVTLVTSSAEEGLSLYSIPGRGGLYGDMNGEENGHVGAESVLYTPPLKHQHQKQKQRQKPHRQPLASVTPMDSNRQPVEHSGGVVDETDKVLPLVQTPKRAVASAAAAPVLPTTPVSAVVVKTEEQKAVEAVAVARKLIAGLSRGARSHQKVEALSSLRGLADGEGAGGRPDFWPRYFGQVLMLLLEGAATAPATAAGADGGDERGRSGGRGGGLSSSPLSRRRALLRAKHLQGVRCLVARRGGLFPGFTEVVVGRLVEIGGGGGRDPCLFVGCEAEACLADLVGVLDPARYLALLTLLLAPPSDDDGAATAAAPSAAAAGEAAVRGACGGGDEDNEPPKKELSVDAQCVVLGALRELTPRLSSPGLLGALGAGPLLAGLEEALGGRDLEARKRAVLALVEMYQVCLLCICIFFFLVNGGAGRTERRAALLFCRVRACSCALSDCSCWCVSRCVLLWRETTKLI